MRARDLLTALSNGFEPETLRGIYLQYQKNLVPFTTIAVDSHGELILFFEPNKPALALKELYTQLMLHKNLTLRYWDGEQTQKVYGFREEEGKIIF
ncbi:hypothetical protein A5886_001507 [Enterococcus sp. 8G7_MSG3316]|uniref:Uncharacterized protein n=1 Tax=Candidatus Enterococcus testudinis TaxID=1834191 RepID=A0A242A6A8_9ENTE|nr:hypothetical protein [Enterococcus sp. 8G7_MSG3316]OTN76430.1 hypothetical protein A5886_001507 [Enterococcus sp. 8G7_MSG3316]